MFKILWSQWLFLLHFEWYSLFLKPVTEIKKISWCQENWDVSKQNGISRRYLFMMSIYFILYQASNLQSMLSTNKGIYIGVPSVTGIMCTKCQNHSIHVCNRFYTSFCTRDYKTNQAFSNLNRKFWNNSALIWMDFPGVRFYPLCSNETASLKNDTFIWIRIYILYLIYILTSFSHLF